MNYCMQLQTIVFKGIQYPFDYGIRNHSFKWLFQARRGQIQEKPKVFMIDLTTRRPKLLPHKIHRMISYYLYLRHFQFVQFKNNITLNLLFLCSRCYVLLRGTANTFFFRLRYKARQFGVTHVSWSYWVLGLKINTENDS